MDNLIEGPVKARRAGIVKSGEAYVAFAVFKRVEVEKAFNEPAKGKDTLEWLAQELTGWMPSWNGRKGMKNPPFVKAGSRNLVVMQRRSKAI